MRFLYIGVQISKKRQEENINFETNYQKETLE